MEGFSMKSSFVSKIRLYLVLLILIIIGILCAFLYSSYEILDEEIKKSSEDFLTIYTRDLKNDLNALDKSLIKVTSDVENLLKIKSSNKNESILAEIALQNNMRETALNDDFESTLVVMDKTNDTLLFGTKSSISLEFKNFVETGLESVLEAEEYYNYEWHFFKYEDETYIYKYIKQGKRVIAIFAETDELLQQFSDENIETRAIILANENGEIGEVWGNVFSEIDTVNNINEIDQKEYYFGSSYVVDEEIQLICLTDKNAMLSQIYLSTIVICIIVILAIIFLIYIFYFVKKQIIEPMECIVEDLDIIRDGDFENRITMDFDSIEFQRLKDTSNEMVDKIIGLKFQSYVRKIELQDMELKSIHLKLKPHFFLNSLTTISSLSNLGENEKIVKYIDVLSRNIRYMFKSGISLVTIDEELQQVENYIFMQELKYPNSVFSFIELSEGLEGWEVPHMVIHTFVENIYKHTISVDTITTILIKVSKYERNNKEYLLIEIEDDGIGYSQEVLEKININDSENYITGAHIGLLSLKKLLELMYEEQGLMTISNGKLGGCYNKIYIPKETKIKAKG